MKLKSNKVGDQRTGRRPVAVRGGQTGLEMISGKEKIAEWGKNVAKKHLDFEIMCKEKSDDAAKALLEAENWTRKRLRRVSF